MKQSKLLNNMRAAFEKKYAQTPEEYGLPEIHVYQDEVMLSASKEVYEAFVASQELAKKVSHHFLYILLALLGATGFIAYAPSEISSSVLYTIVAVVFLLCFFAAYLNYRQYRKLEELEEIYCQKNTHLFYNGKYFYTKSRHKFYSETAFF